MSRATEEIAVDLERHSEPGSERDALLAEYNEAVLHEGEPLPTLTETGLAEVFVDRHGRELRYCGEWRKWLAWDGKRWRIDTSGRVQRRVKRTLRDLRLDADRQGDEKLVRRLFGAEKRNVRDNIDALARHEEDVQLALEELDTHPLLFNVRNGTLDLSTGRLREHRREDLLTKMAPVTYDPTAGCPRWLAFLDRIFAGDAELISFVQRAAGYSLTGDIGEHALFILWGGGRNGKSTLLLALLALLGDYGRPGVHDLLLSKKHDAHPTELADLFGARFVAFQETQQGQRFDESKVKALTGGDQIKARRMREDFWDFSPTHKFWLGTNHRPTIRGTDLAIWRRMKLIPFTVTIPPEECDPKLLETLRSELPGILNWVVDGCREWRRAGLAAPEAVTKATDAYRQAEDRFAAFLADCCVIGPGKRVDFTPLYTRFRQWADANGDHPLSAKAFGQELDSRGFEADIAGHDRHKIRCGIGLLEGLRTDEDRLSGLSPTRARVASEQEDRSASVRIEPLREPGEDEEELPGIGAWS